MSLGFVSLVGAGPGDPDLLTRRAAARLGEADLVLYDALVAPEVLDLAPRAQRFPVGKRAGRPSLDQSAINRLLIREARRGRRVVRLKGGDPFVLGRGGEEALALAAAGVPFEVVPGVTNAVAAPELAGIPVTHRGLSSAFLVVSGHDESAYRPVLDSFSPGAATIVVLMGLATRAAVAALLCARGWDPATPAAIAFAAGSRRASTWKGTLRELADGAPDDPPDAAGTIVIGAVVSLSRVIAAAAGPPPGIGSADEGGDEVSVRFPLHRFGW
jgi:uroporphyrin-III C-methyltransferase/precorrin-2 dehydrogenase/sirohydrochlorin ferrochelatase